MIKIDNLYYDCVISERKIDAGRGFEDIIVLEIDKEFANIDLIRTKDNIYQIGDILKTFKEDNIYWLELLEKSANLDSEMDNFIVEELKAENHKLKEQSKDLADKLETSVAANRANILALIEVNSRLNKIEKEVK